MVEAKSSGWSAGRSHLQLENSVMPSSEDGAAAAAEAHFEALRRFVDERNIASHQQRPVHAANGAHVPPFKVKAGDSVDRHEDSKLDSVV